jgi:hypothetical protein
VLLASRPHPTFEAAVETSKRWLVVEPRALDGSNVVNFAAAYAPGPVADRNALRRWLEPLRTASGNAEEMYSPILVRLAMLLYDTRGALASANIADVYREALSALLRKKNLPPDLLDRTAELCVDTYWKDASRMLPYADAPGQRKTHILDPLRAAGILAPVGALTNRKGATPQWLRFFHDSMQSFLTARGLFQHEHWNAFAIAAGRRQFCEQRSEIFDMCLAVFGPEQRVLDTLADDVVAWSNTRLPRKITEDALETHVPQAVQAAWKVQVGGGGVAVAMRLAATLCKGHGLPALASFYRSLAPVIWTLGHEGERTATAVLAPQREEIVRIVSRVCTDTPSVQALGERAAVDLLFWDRSSRLGHAIESLLELAGAQGLLEPLFDGVLAMFPQSPIGDQRADRDRLVALRALL